MAEKFEITDEMRAQIGKEGDPWTHEVTTTGVRAFARGVGYTDTTYYDIDEANAKGLDALPAPPCYLGFPIFIPGRSDGTFSGPRGAGGVAHGLPGLLDGGTETTYERPIKAGDILEARSALTNLETKTSPSLGVMLLTTQETTYRDKATGDVVARQRAQAIFY